MAVFSMVPPNFCGGAGSCFPSIVVVEAGEPGSCAITDVAATVTRAVARRPVSGALTFNALSLLAYNVYIIHRYDALYLGILRINCSGGIEHGIPESMITAPVPGIRRR
jgi:hypothetical protein